MREISHVNCGHENQGANPSYRWLANTSEHEGVSQSDPCATFSSDSGGATALHASKGEVFPGEPLPSPVVSGKNWFRQTSALRLRRPRQPDGPDSKDPPTLDNGVPFFIEQPQEPHRPCWVDRHEGCHRNASHTKVVSTVTYWSQTLRVGDDGASEIYSKRHNAKEVIFPKEGEFIFPIAGGRMKTLGGDQDLRTSTLVLNRPIQGESNIDFLGESEGSLPQPQDSFPDAGEAINDFWSMSGNFIYRHHVEPRVKLYSLSDESFPIPLKYINVSKTTHTNLDVKQEKRINDYWNIDGSRDLSDPWTGFTQFTLLEEKPPDGYMWSGERLTRKQITSRPDHLWPELWKLMGKHAKLKEKQKWSNEKLHLLKTRENCEGTISLTRRTRNSKRPSRMRVRSWKHQSLLLCRVKL